MKAHVRTLSLIHSLSRKAEIEIAQEAKMKPITEIAASLGLADEDVIPLSLIHISASDFFLRLTDGFS